MTEVDCCITTMNRPQALERLLLSLAAHWPEASVHVADQSERFDGDRHERLADRLQETGLRRRPTVHRLPFDCGVSAARNFLVDSTPGRYKFVVDDDGVFTEHSDIGALARLLDANPQAGVVGASASHRGHVAHMGTLLTKEGGTLRHTLASGGFQEHEGLRFKQVDCVPNCALMRQELFDHVRWDPAFKTAEHFDFYLRVKECPYAVLSTPDVSGDHLPIEVDASYTELRWRAEFMELMMSRYELTRIEMLDGTVLELRADGELVRHLSDGREIPYDERRASRAA